MLSGAPSRKARALLAYLALARGRAQSRDRLAGLLWTDCRETQARMSLRQALTALRKALGDTATWLHADGESVALASPTAVNCLEFEALVTEGFTTALERAVALYRDDLLDGLSISEPAFEQWLAAERERLRTLALGALERLLKHHIAQDDIEQAIEIATWLLTLDSLREDTHRALMRLYQRQGRIAPVLAQYRACHTLLRCELGVLPEPETEALYRSLLEDRKTCPATAVPESAPVASAPQHPTELTIEPTPGASAEPQLREAAVLVVELSGIADAVDPEAHHAQRVHQIEVIEALAHRHNGQCLRQPGETLVNCLWPVTRLWQRGIACGTYGAGDPPGA